MSKNLTRYALTHIKISAIFFNFLYSLYIFNKDLYLHYTTIIYKIFELNSEYNSLLLHNISYIPNPL